MMVVARNQISSWLIASSRWAWCFAFKNMAWFFLRKPFNNWKDKCWTIMRLEYLFVILQLCCLQSWSDICKTIMRLTVDRTETGSTPHAMNHKVCKQRLKACYRIVATHPRCNSFVAYASRFRASTSWNMMFLFIECLTAKFGLLHTLLL